MSDNVEYSVFLTEIDCLFDTRLSTLHSLNNNLLEEVIKKDYHNRPIDNFSSEYNIAYKQRTKNILKDVILTPIFPMIKDFINKTLSQSVNTPFIYKPKIVINIFPYGLMEQEIDNILKSLIILTDKLADIEIINMSYEEITPLYLKNNVSIVTMYNYNEWLETHAKLETFKKQSCPEVTLFAPAIYFAKPEVIEDDAFKAMELLTAPFINLKLLPINNFSFILPKK